MNNIKIIVKNILLAAAVVFMPVSLVAQLPVSRPHLVQTKHKVVAQVKDINNTNTDGVSRIGVYLISTPNTSSRIDSVSLENGTKRFIASDIDGVDFKRYFQWEDNGEIYVEVDFPLQTKFSRDASVTFHTVYGDVKANIKNTTSKRGSKGK